MKFPDKIKLVNKSIIIPWITKEDGGIYECVGTTKERNIWSGLTVTFKAYGTLLIISKYYYCYGKSG